MSTNSMVITPGLASAAKRRTRRLTLHYGYVFPAVVMFVLFVAYPIVWVIFQSLLGSSSSHRNDFVGLNHYWQLFQDPVFWQVLLNMFIWGLITVPVQMVIG